mmetsp:Transcript_6762/g.17224  ORF Transcript_6762/g.17224 Transcript_6762/m.17224 type:complete len:115 (+) Transcript_6762:1193-1537(+)
MNALLRGWSTIQTTVPTIDTAATPHEYARSFPVSLYNSGIAFGNVSEDAAVAVRIKLYTTVELIGAKSSRDRDATRTLQPAKTQESDVIKKREKIVFPELVAMGRTSKIMPWIP